MRVHSWQTPTRACDLMLLFCGIVLVFVRTSCKSIYRVYITKQRNKLLCALWTHAAQQKNCAHHASQLVSDQSKRPKSGACVAQLVLGHWSATTTDRLTDVDEAFVKLPAVLGRHWITVIRHRSSLPSAAGICNDSYFAVIPDGSQGKLVNRLMIYASVNSSRAHTPPPPPPPALLRVRDSGVLL